MSKKKATIIEGIFVSYWTEGKVVTPCCLDPDGQLFPDVVEVGDMGTLESEKFYGGDSVHGEEYTVCPDCHEYVLTKNQVCTNPDCN